jgi:hypothetical protein
LAARVMNKIEHEEELATYKALASVNRELKFAVPKNYFESLANILEYKYEHAVYPQLSDIKKIAPKALPDNYFEKLNEKVMAKIEQSSELSEFPLLSSIEKKNNFKLEPTYFEKSIDDVKEAIHAKGVAFPDFLEQIFNFIFRPRMAFAFAILLLVGISSIVYLNNNRTQEITGDCHTVACLEKNEMLNEKHAEDFDDENLYDMVDVDELDKQITKKNSNSDL